MIGFPNITDSKKIRLDFKNVNLISPAFADELVRKIKKTDPNIEIQWIKEFSNATYSFLDSTLYIDEFKEIYLIFLTL